MKNIHTLTALFLLCILTHSCDNKSTSGNKESPAAETPMQDTTQIDTSGKMVSRDTLSITRTKTIPLLLTVNELVSPKAPIRVAIYNSNENFLLKEGRIREFVIQPDGEKAMSEISDLEYGIYAIVVFQDLNNSGDMDKISSACQASTMVYPTITSQKSENQHSTIVSLHTIQH